MNPEVKEKWLAALRSGRYRKARRTLRSFQGAYCCLGVLCEIAVDAGVINDYDGARSYPPADVLSWAGIDADFQASHRALYPLVRANDTSAGYDKAIAMIEARL